MTSLLTMRLPTAIKKKLELKAKNHHRSLTGEISYYIQAGMLAEENPDLPFELIRQTLEARAELKSGFKRSYPWGIFR